MLTSRAQKRQELGTPLPVQWLRLSASRAEGVGSIPDQGTRSYMPWAWPKTKKLFLKKESGGCVLSFCFRVSSLDDPVGLVVMERAQRETRGWKLARWVQSGTWWEALRGQEGRDIEMSVGCPVSEPNREIWESLEYVPGILNSRSRDSFRVPWM